MDIIRRVIERIGLRHFVMASFASILSVIGTGCPGSQGPEQVIQWPSDDLTNVHVVKIDTIGECLHRYHIAFDDAKSTSPGSYWVGLEKSTRDTIVAYGSSVVFTPPFYGKEGTVDLFYNNPYIDFDDQLRAIAVRGNSPGDAASGSAIGESGEFYDSGFPTSCDFAIEVYSDDGPVDPGGCAAYISAVPDPMMPGMIARAAGGNPAEMVIWTMQISYNRSGRNDTNTYGDTLYATDIWDLKEAMGSAIRGGQVHLTCRTSDSIRIASFSFGIRAANPSENDAENYITAWPDSLWYIKFMAMHESDSPSQGRYYAQFNEVGADYCGPGGIRYTPNTSNAGQRQGFGIFQLTYFHDRAPYSQELWSWKTNVDTALGLIHQHQSNGRSYMWIERANAFNYSSGFFRVPDETVGNVTFSDPTDKVIEHAVAMKRYNGLGGTGNREYCEWLEDEHIWSFNRFNDFSPPFNYVELVCNLFTSR